MGEYDKDRLDLLIWALIFIVAGLCMMVDAVKWMVFPVIGLTLLAATLAIWRKL